MRFQDLLVYKKGFDLSMERFNISKSFPKKEIYLLTNSVRYIFRSDCAKMSEDFRKRLYPMHFLRKFIYCSAENFKTQTEIEFAFSFNYINKYIFKEFAKERLEVGKLLNYTIVNPEIFGLK